MTFNFTTLGNATVVFNIHGKPILATDPWLTGTCYFGSWALDHALLDSEISRIQQSEYLWISHGHPDHLHHPSLDLLPKDKKILIPDHYSHEIEMFLRELGFRVDILRYRHWYRLRAGLDIMCIDNENQDAILIARFGDALVINLNDSPLCGEGRFIARLVRRHGNDRVFLLALCSIDADMFNFVDKDGQRLVDHPEVLKPGAIQALSRKAERLGAKHYCCSSSQHLYVRADSAWANPYRVTYADLTEHWSRPAIEIIPPFVTVDASTGSYVENLPRDTDFSQVTTRTWEDDWTERLTADEWQKVESFIGRFKMLSRHVDFVEISVGGEIRRFVLRTRAKLLNGITFEVPRRSLLETVAYGYWDDLLIGNFMRTRLHGKAKLYPCVTPLIAKRGGNAKVFDRNQYRSFVFRYFYRNPIGFVTWRLQQLEQFVLLPYIRERAIRLGIFEPLKRIYHVWILRDPVY